MKRISILASVFAVPSLASQGAPLDGLSNLEKDSGVAEIKKSFGLLLARQLTGWRLRAVLLGCLVVIGCLGYLRVVTHAEFVFASLASLPVLTMAWVGNKRYGVTGALIAAGMWVLADSLAEKQFSSSWVMLVNGVTHFLNYGLLVFLAHHIRLEMQKVQKSARLDALTGLQNRRGFQESGILEIERARRYSRALAVVFIDLDNFKKLNDTRGHDAGDDALKAVAKALRGGLRATDQIARLGGDEFAALLPEIGHDDALQAINKVFAGMSHALETFSPVAASVGMVWFEEVDRTFDDMLKAADELMYQVKADGKGHVRSQSFWKQKPELV